MSSNKKTFLLHDLIASERLTLSMEADNVTAVFDSILCQALNTDAKHPFLIGIDGSVTAGKSFLSSQLEEYLHAKGLDCIIIHGDWFMAARKVRQQEIDKASTGTYKITDYDAVACNFDEIARMIDGIRVFMNNDESQTIINLPHIYDRESGETDETITISIKKQMIIILEGTGILREHQSEVFDLSIRVDVKDYDETVRRLVLRESEKIEANRLSDEFITRRYHLIDWPYDTYLRSRDRKYFDYLIDTTDQTSLKIYARNN